MGTEIVVRPATERDQSVIAAHRTAAAEESAKYRGSIPTMPSTLACEDFVASVDEVVLGSITVGVSSATTATITHVHVQQDARGVGVGDALLSHCVNHMRGRGFSHITAMAQPGDRQLKNLFERHGLVAETIIVGKEL